MSEDLQKIANGATEFGQIVLDILRPISDRFVAMGQEIMDAMYAAYVADGAIYGETREGMLRWMEETNEIARLRGEAQRMEDHHTILRDFGRTNKPT
jgi:hypothetical protein